MEGKQHQSSPEEQTQQQTPEQPLDVTHGTQQIPAASKNNQGAEAGCPAHPGKLNHTEDDRNNPIDGKNAQDQLFDCKDV